MNIEEMTKKNIEMGAEFSRYLFDHPEMEERIPTGAELILLPEEDGELEKHNREMGVQIQKTGIDVQFIRIGSLRPRRYSRIEKAELLPHL